MFEQELQSLKAKGLYRRLHEVETAQGPRIRMNGREMISLASNNYLGLASHPRLKEAVCEAANQYGAGSGASRLLSGTCVLHTRLEEEIVGFLGEEAALIFNSGYAANTGILSALCGKEDLILCDVLNHASIVDGCRLSRSDVKLYRHLDCDMLEDRLKRSNKYHYKRGWIVTESLFSMDGDLAPLPELAALAERYGAHLYLDEAHAIGVLGDKGRGSASLFGVEDRITLRMGTLSKALGSFGAFAAGDREIINLLINRARSLIYSTALPPPVLAASRAALELVRTDQGDRLRKRLFSNIRRLARGLKGIGFEGITGETPILPLILGPVNKALAAAQALYEGGVFAPAIRPPTVPKGKSRLRFSVMAQDTAEDLDTAVLVLGRFLRGPSAEGPGL